MGKFVKFLSAALMLSAISCSQNPGGLQKGTDAYDAFQRKSIARVGLNMKLALTFDDGPTNGTTDALLELLKQEGIKASFFLNGKHIRGREATVRRMQQDGHVVANHSHTHAHLPRAAQNIGMSEVFKEVNRSHQAISPYLQPNGRLYFRAPFGAWRAEFADFLNRDQLLRDYIGPVFWDIGGSIVMNTNGSVRAAADWDCWDKTSETDEKLSVEQCAYGYLNESLNRRGGIVLMHDVNMKTVDLVRNLIPRWRRAGFTFVTLDEIQALDQYASPEAITRARAEESQSLTRQ